MAISQILIVLFFAAGSLGLHRWLLRRPGRNPVRDDAAIYTEGLARATAALLPAAAFWAWCLVFLILVSLFGERLPSWIALTWAAFAIFPAGWMIKEFVRPTRSRLPDWARDLPQ